MTTLNVVSDQHASVVTPTWLIIYKKKWQIIMTTYWHLDINSLKNTSYYFILSPIILRSRQFTKLCISFYFLYEIFYIKNLYINFNN